MGVLFVSCVLSGGATEWIPIIILAVSPTVVREQKVVPASRLPA